MNRSPLEGMSLALDGFRCQVSGGVVQMSGALQMRTPSAELGPFLRKIHDLALQTRLTEVPVDVKLLQHVNSSSLFLFLDWARWIAAAPADRRYTLHFLTRAGIPWQHLALPTMQRICAGSIRTSAGLAQARSQGRRGDRARWRQASRATSRPARAWTRRSSGRPAK